MERIANINATVAAIAVEDYSKALTICALYTSDEKFIRDVIDRAYLKTADIIRLSKFLSMLNMSKAVQASGFDILLSKIILENDFKEPNIFDFIIYLQKSISMSGISPASPLQAVNASFYSLIRDNLSSLSYSIIDTSRASIVLNYANADADGYLVQLLGSLIGEASTNYDATIRFVKTLTLDPHKLVALNVIWMKMKNNHGFLNAFALPLAYQIKAAMISAPAALQPSYQEIKNKLPNNVIAIIWNNVRLKNILRGDFMYSPTETFDKISEVCLRLDSWYCSCVQC